MSAPLSLLDVIAQIPDPRSRHGQRPPPDGHPLSRRPCHALGSSDLPGHQSVRPREGLRPRILDRLQTRQDPRQVHFLHALSPPRRTRLRGRFIPVDGQSSGAEPSHTNSPGRQDPSNIITGDAMFCQRDVCQKIVEAGGDYVFTVKDNQPSLVIDREAGLAYQEQARRRSAAFSP